MPFSLKLNSSRWETTFFFLFFTFPRRRTATCGSRLSALRDSPGVRTGGTGARWRKAIYTYPYQSLFVSPAPTNGTWSPLRSPPSFTLIAFFLPYDGIFGHIKIRTFSLIPE